MSPQLDNTERLAALLQKAGQTLAVAESCTGGRLAAELTRLPGSSNWFEAGVVTYRLSAKSNLLEVPQPLLREHGAVSETVALAMAQGVLDRTAADVSIATTGLAGPDGDGSGAPVGTLWIGWATRQPHTLAASHFYLNTSRENFRHWAVTRAIDGLIQHLTSQEIL